LGEQPDTRQNKLLPKIQSKRDSCGLFKTHSAGGSYGRQKESEKDQCQGGRQGYYRHASARANGCTREEVLKETGWSAVSFQQQAKAAGIKLKIDKSVRPFRYKEG
jgi:hypothetical protein